MKHQNLFRIGQMAILFISLFGFSFSPHMTIARPESSQMAHYIVFEKHDDGTIAPVYYHPVKLAAPMQSVSDRQLTGYLAQPSRNAERMVVVLQTRDENIVYQDVVEISPWLRGEFHGATAGDQIDGYILPAEDPAFVVRVPMIKGTTLVIKDAWQTTIAQFDLIRLVAETPLITLDSRAVAESQSITGPAANRVDFLIMGEGYTAAQSVKFTTDATNAASQFFSISPYSVYQNYFNIHTLFTASIQSGADHPSYSPSCGYWDPNCCGDSEMLSDPQQGKMVSTAFDGRYCTNWIHRLLSVNNSKVFAAAAAMPDWDTILVIVNDATYGGSGGTFSVVSMYPEASQIAQHEFGHSFVNLADEYESAFPGYPTCSDITAPACESNVTDITNRLQIKWNPWILPTTPIPTPETNTYNGLVGLFEGARYFTTGKYRPGLNCLMRTLGAPFCQVPSQSFVLKLYKGGWGVPNSGISMIEPGSTLPTTPLLLIHPATQPFHADTLGPVGGPPEQISWLDNGVPIPGTVGNTITYTTNATSPGLHYITMHVKDMTSLVIPAMAGTALDDEYTWVVSVLVPVLIPSNIIITSDSPDPSVLGQAIIVNYTVTSIGGTPTGSVTVSDGVDSCAATVAAGTCTLTLTTLGAKTLTATYAGDANFNGSSGTASHTVNKTVSTTTITLDSPDPSVVRQAVVVSYTVTSPGGTPTGSVTVSDGVDSCAAIVAAGTCTLTPTTSGTKTLTATYTGDENFNGSSGTASHTVNKSDSTTTITSDNPDPSVRRQAVVVIYTVTSTGETPTGNVTVSDGVDSCAATVAAGTCTLTPTTSGVKTLTATYAGDANFNGSSGTASHMVNKTINEAESITTITSDNPDPSVVKQSVVVSYTVTSPGGTPTGNVIVSDGVDSCTATVAAGTCILTPTTAGAKTLTAIYTGDENFNGSTSVSVAHTVKAVIFLPLVLR